MTQSQQEDSHTPSQLTSLITSPRPIPWHIEQFLRECGQFVCIYNGRWNQLQFDLLCPTLTAWDVSQLKLQKNKHASIIRDIHHIHFAKLTQLLLIDNHIQSIEPISHMTMPSLQQLHFDINSISNIRSLSKINCPKLRKIGFTMNKINQMNSLAQLYAPALQSMAIQFQFYNQMCVDINFICKLQTKSLKWLFIRGQNRIKRNKLVDQIQKKYHDFGYGINVRTNQS